MPKIKKLKFEYLEELHEYHEENILEIYKMTLDLLENYFNKHGKLGEIDIFKIELKSNPDMEFISILESEWGYCLDEMIGYLESVENYELAIRVRDLNNKIYDYEE